MRVALLSFVIAWPWFFSGPSDSPSVTAEIAVRQAYATVRERRTFSPAPPVKCCGKCVNGKVKSGDGLAWVSCPCPSTCKCKGAK